MKHLKPLLYQGKKIGAAFNLFNFTAYMYTVFKYYIRSQKYNYMLKHELHKAFLDMESFTWAGTYSSMQQLMHAGS